MNIDGDTVVVGDNLFDIVNEKSVTVQCVDGDTMDVCYTDGSVVKFSGAYFNGVRRLYWLDPRVLIPRKCDTRLIYTIRGIIGVLRG